MSRSPTQHTARRVTPLCWNETLYATRVVPRSGVRKPVGGGWRAAIGRRNSHLCRGSARGSPVAKARRSLFGASPANLARMVKRTWPLNFTRGSKPFRVKSGTVGQRLPNAMRSLRRSWAAHRGRVMGHETWRRTDPPATLSSRRVETPDGDARRHEAGRGTQAFRS